MTMMEPSRYVFAVEMAADQVALPTKDEMATTIKRIESQCACLLAFGVSEQDVRDEIAAGREAMAAVWGTEVYEPEEK
ncbi:MAG: hypothetical protein KGL39_49385 [Patescibacteria group bacterium]|nr:hypothetical protein [Patescibacteria group bacterium]